MSKEIYISSTPHETRLAIVEKEELSEIYYERENEYTLAGSIYNGRVTRVLPGMQSAFVDVGLERDAFLYITDFLEEQGEDAAEFEGGDAGSGEPRSEATRDRGGERSDRGDRNSDRRRGDRDRGGRGRDAEARAAAPELQSAPAQIPTERNEAAPTSAETPDQGEETGDGSRRWRGRRGRRRGGRGGEGRTPEATPGTTLSPEVEVPLVPAEPESEPVERIFGEAESTPEQRPREAREGRERGGRERDGRGRGRGGDRDRGRDRGEERPRSADRETRDVEAVSSRGEDTLPPLILPGESLSRYRQQDGAEADTTSEASFSARPQPSYLKARPSTEIDLSVAAWDGGQVLPGETLSRRRDTPAPSAPSQGRARTESTSSQTPEVPEAQETSGSGDQGSGSEEAATGSRGSLRRRHRDRRSGRGGREMAGQVQEGTDRAEAATAAEEETPSSFRSGAVLHEELTPQQAVQPGITTGHEPEAEQPAFAESPVADISASDAEATADSDVLEPAPDSLGAKDIFYEPETDLAPQAGEFNAEVMAAVEQMHAGLAASAEVPTIPAEDELEEETAEYEPEDEASASYRVDPASPSEFRQASPTEEDEVGGGDPLVQEDYAGTEHQYTTLGDTGELLSELPGEVSIPGIEQDPANPIEHETAVLTQRASELLGETAMAQPAEAGARDLSEGVAPAFAPGDGFLEEEELDEDDTELLAVAASYSDDTEEETFEAGADLGALVRDRALDAMTQLEPAEVDDDEEDDFDIAEEDLEEDELQSTDELAGSDLSEVEEDDLLTGETMFEEGDKPAAASMGEFPEFTEERPAREPRRGATDRGSEGAREPRRSGGDRDRGGRDRGSRDRRGMAGSRAGGGGGGRSGRHSMQTTDLPAISDLLKPGQEVLVQIAKEPIAKKGARITSHIALPGRFLVFMPTVNHVGVSRKIESDSERRRLKEVLLSEKGDAAGGFIVRTAASGASEDELRSDLRFLLNLWSDIKQRSEGSKSPALIYHDLNLVERILRDQVSENFSAIWCDTEVEYERVLRFLQRFEPSLMRRVKLYTKETPLFEQFGISEEINKALRSKVWLKSGGSIVINQTEALVAIDINTGKYVGKTARLEDTIVKTNLDAIPEIVRQVRLRDLGGIIVIDFIDMDDRKNRQKVLLALEEELKKDRAPSKVLQFNDFGLVAITRKRVKQSLERTLSTTCGICAGTGMVKSPVTVCNEIYIELRKMHKQLDKGDVMLRVNPEVVKQLKSNNTKWLQEMEEIAGKTILIKSDPSLHPEQFDIH